MIEFGSELQEVAIDKNVQDGGARGAGIVPKYDVRTPALDPNKPVVVPELHPQLFTEQCFQQGSAFGTSVVNKTVATVLNQAVFSSRFIMVGLL